MAEKKRPALIGDFMSAAEPALSAPPRPQPSLEPTRSAPPAAPRTMTFVPRGAAAVPAMSAPALSVPAPEIRQPAPALSVPAPEVRQPAPALSVPALLPAMPAPSLSAPVAVPAMPAPALSVPSLVPPMPAPATSAPAALPEMPAPIAALKADLPRMPPPLAAPKADLPHMPAPAPSVPATLPEMPAPEPRISLVAPMASPAFVPAGPASVPEMLPPALSVPALLPEMPAPPAFPKADPPPMPPPAPSAPALLPEMPAPPPSAPALLPEMPAPPPSAPALLPEMPAPAPGVRTDPPEMPAPVPSVSAKLPAMPTPVLPDSFAPGGSIDPARDYLSKLKSPDAAVKEAFAKIDAGERYADHGGAPGSLAGDPRAHARRFQDISKALGGPLGVAEFVAKQAGLFALNRYGKVFDPLTGISGPPPGGGGVVHLASDTLFNGHESQVMRPSPSGDRHLALHRGTYSDAQPMASQPGVMLAVNAGRAGPHRVADLVGPRAIGANSQDSSLVDDPTALNNPTISGMPLVAAALETRNLYTQGHPYSVQTAREQFSLGQLFEDFTKGGNATKIVVDDPATGRKRVDIKAIYSPRQVRLGGIEFRPVKPPPTALAQPSRGFTGGEAKLARAYYAGGVIPSRLEGEGDFGFILTTIRQEDPSAKVDDDAAYVPLSFMDTRVNGGSNKVRTVYFRPFINSLTEELTPEWNAQSFFGRVDPVATYMGTGRTLSLAFAVQSFSPEDLETIYQKKNWLASMCYPSYDKDLLMKAGPVIRLRVGDLLKTRGGFGLPGIIEGLTFDYTESLWELSRGRKVPMGFKVSLQFRVLHEVPIGIGIDGKFGGIGRIDPGTGLWQRPKSTDNARAQNAPELAPGAIGDFAGGPGSKLNDYRSK